MKSLLVLLILWSSPVFAFSSESARLEAQQLLQNSNQHTQMVDRLDYFSAHFLGLPYGVNGPLGEGDTGRYDQDPLYRFDTFDCTTFVETVTSLARSASLDQFEIMMNRIRYRNGVVDYLERKHFPAMQWIPQNIQDGFFVEANALVLPFDRIHLATNTNDFGNWLRFARPGVIQISGIDENARLGLLAELQSFASNYQPVKVSIEYLPIRDLVSNPEVLSRIPSGSVVNFVRPNWQLADKIGTNLLVSHQGFIFQRAGVTYLRHASSGSEKRVVEVPFIDYLRAISPDSSLKGIHLLQPAAAN
jgi:hypothetical protein